MKKKLLVIVFLISLCEISFSQNKSDKICGVYEVVEQTEVSKVQISRLTGNSFEGKIIWMKQPKFPNGTPKTDIKNPDPKKRNTPADKIVLLKNFKYNAANDEWEGEIYNPVEGKTYKAYAEFEKDNLLKVRGYVGLPAFGRSVYWKKIK